MLRRLLLASAAAGAPLLAQNAPPLKPSHFQGQVVDTAGHPVKSAVVETDDPPTAVVSNDSGFFRFSELPAGPITVRVRRAGFQGVAFQLRLPSDSTVSIAVRLTPSPQILDVVEAGAGPGARAGHARAATPGYGPLPRAGVRPCSPRASAG